MDDTHNRESCCHSDNKHNPHRTHAKRFDVFYHGSILVLVTTIALHFILSFADASPSVLHHFAMACLELLGSMWWGIVLGIVAVGIIGKIPREFFTGLMGRDDSFGGLVRAVGGGLVLDLCSHGILIVAAKLYERGVSLAQVVAFLVASPWNSFSLTLVLIGLIGFKWTFLYILGSMVIALLTGMVMQTMTKSGALPQNPNKTDHQENFVLKDEIKILWSRASFTKATISDVIFSGWHDGRMIVKWLLFGTILAASIRTFIPQDIFQDWFGPTMAGLLLTVIAATFIEICSEGSAPIASELVVAAQAPGNGFAFLMAGVATDYTEILVVREFSGSWKVALFIPLITVPQVLFIGWLMNMATMSG
ncbi:MAG: permease [Alphaproteobacteria bacterium]|nr:permease [Alphaproteobacteria bacterium]